MKISRHTLLLTASLLAAIGPAHAFASDANAERDISVYDKQPQCSERRELKPGQSDPCEIQNGPPRRRAIGANNGATQGGNAGNATQAGASSSSSPSSSSSANTSQGSAQVRR